jgi:hypothetical protein
MLVANEMKIIITTIISRVIAIITCPHVHHIFRLISSPSKTPSSSHSSSCVHTTTGGRVTSSTDPQCCVICGRWRGGGEEEEEKTLSSYVALFVSLIDRDCVLVENILKN